MLHGSKKSDGASVRCHCCCAQKAPAARRPACCVRAKCGAGGDEARHLLRCPSAKVLPALLDGL